MVLVRLGVMNNFFLLGGALRVIFWFLIYYGL